MLCNGRDPDWMNGETLVFSVQNDEKYTISSRATSGAKATTLLSSDSPIRHTTVDRSHGRIAYVRSTALDGSDGDVWIYQLASKQSTQISSHPARDDAPTWSADGNKLYFRSTREGAWGVWFKVL